MLKQMRMNELDQAKSVLKDNNEEKWRILKEKTHNIKT